LAGIGSASRVNIFTFSLIETLENAMLAVDVLSCPVCGSRRRWISAITEREVIERILSHLDLNTDLPAPALARPPPQEALPF